MKMQSREYQKTAISKTIEALRDHESALVVSATGTGKTHIAQSLAGMASGKVLVVGQTKEVIDQLTDACRRSGKRVGVEMAERTALKRHQAPPEIVVATVQTLCSGDGKRLRDLVKNPSEWSLSIFDEAHHATANSYLTVKNHMMQNQRHKLVGFTATPKRGDDVRLGSVFDTVAFDFGFLEAMEDGWLVNMEARIVTVESLDFSEVKTTAGDLNGRDLDRVMRVEKNIIGICDTVRQMANEGDRKKSVLMFCTSVEDADRRAEIFNRYEPGSAMMVCGTTPKAEREAMLRRFANRDFHYLTNVAVATEGWDCPQVDIVCPSFTKSWGRYVQQVGRGCRPLPDIVSNDMTRGERLSAIAKSDKPSCQVVDFVGVTARHRLINGINIHEGRHPSDVLDRLAEAMADGLPMTDIDAAVAEQLERDKQAKEKEALDAKRRRAALVANAKFKVKSGDLFSQLNMAPVEYESTEPASDKLVEFIAKHAKVDARDWSKEAAIKLQRVIFSRWKRQLCSLPQKQLLEKRGWDGDVTFKEAKRILDTGEYK
jgi:superfamily II DNA or RNA helicase